MASRIEARANPELLVWARETAAALRSPRSPMFAPGVGVKCIPLLGMFKELGWQF